MYGGTASTAPDGDKILIYFTGPGSKVKAAHSSTAGKFSGLPTPDYIEAAGLALCHYGVLIALLSF